MTTSTDSDQQTFEQHEQMHSNLGQSPVLKTKQSHDDNIDQDIIAKSLHESHFSEQSKPVLVDSGKVPEDEPENTPDLDTEVPFETDSLEEEKEPVSLSGEKEPVSLSSHVEPTVSEQDPELKSEEQESHEQKEETTGKSEPESHPLEKVVSYNVR